LVLLVRPVLLVPLEQVAILVVPQVQLAHKAQPDHVEIQVVLLVLLVRKEQQD
jgi:hypothetical protein